MKLNYEIDVAFPKSYLSLMFCHVNCAQNYFEIINTQSITCTHAAELSENIPIATSLQINVKIATFFQGITNCF